LLKGVNLTMFPFKTALNASTLFPFQLTIKEQITIAAEAGYEGIELWVKDLVHYFANGGSVTELKATFSETGIRFVNAIAFFAWSDECEEQREQAFIQAEQQMNLLTELGCAAVAAPPFGNVNGVSLEAMARNFARLSDLGARIGIKPYLEFWGRANKLSRLSEAVYVAMESGVPDAQILLDPFHMYTGGSDIENLAFIHGERIGIVHVNDYPDTPARDEIADRDRVFPGHGKAPSQRLARLLHKSGYNGFLSLELFRENFGALSALEVAKRGLDAIRNTYQVNNEIN
jgi:2-keto-myo-inositol isomerase